MQNQQATTQLISKESNRIDNTSERLGTSISDEVRSRQRGMYTTILPDTQKANLLFHFISQMISITRGAPSNSIYVLCRDLIRCLDFNMRERDTSIQELASEHVDELIRGSCLVLQSAFYEHCRVARKHASQFAHLSSQLDKLYFLLSYIEQEVLATSFLTDNIVARDDQQLPVWALIFYGLRAGLYHEVCDFCKIYKGAFMSEISKLHEFLLSHADELAITAQHSDVCIGKDYTQKVEMPSVLLTSQEVFMKALAALFERRGNDMPPALGTNLHDYIWFHLFCSRDTSTINPTRRLLDLHKKLSVPVD